MLTRAIVRPPAENFAQGLTTAGLGPPNYELALVQHRAYCRALEQCGLALTNLDADSDYPDSTFVEDTAVLIANTSDDQPNPAGEFGALITRPGALSRRDEVISIRCALPNWFSSWQEIQPPGTLDGGDVCEAGDRIFVGLSERTNEAGAQQLAAWLMPFGHSTTLIDIRNLKPLLHLKSGIAYLGNDRLVIVDEIAGCSEFDGYDLIRVDSDEQYAANCIRVNDHVLIASGYPKFESSLEECGFKTLTLEMSEFQKMDGGLSCLSLRF